MKAPYIIFILHGQPLSHNVKYFFLQLVSQFIRANKIPVLVHAAQFVMELFKYS